jgi:alpha-L-rhamnosidase
LHCAWPDHGFRYIQIEGVPEDGLPVWELEARVVHSDVESSSSLSFGGAAAASLNQLQSNLEWTQRDNLHSVPTDCNQRTERQGWMADASVSAETAHHNFAMKPFYRNWLRSIVDVQQDFPAADPNDHRPCGTQGRADCVGAVTDTVPHPPGTFGTRPADPSWSSSFDLTYWYLIRYSGDKRIANGTYPALKSYVEYMLSIAAKDSSGLLRWGTTFDWLEQQWPTGSPNYHVKIRNDMTSAFNTILGVKILADAATLLKNDVDAAHYGGVVKDALEKWHATFCERSAIAATACCLLLVLLLLL